MFYSRTLYKIIQIKIPKHNELFSRIPSYRQLQPPWDTNERKKIEKKPQQRDFLKYMGILVMGNKRD